MSHLSYAAPRATAAAPISHRRVVARWLASFAGFPLGGVAAMALVGPVDRPVAALVGGLSAGAVLGAAQGWSLRLATRGRRAELLRWVGATALGFGVGLTAGSRLVDYRTTLGALVVQGAVTGILVGAAQAAVLIPRLGRRSAAWPAILALLWAAGWAVTTTAGVRVDDQFAVFGSTGAIVVTLATSVLPLALVRSDHAARVARSTHNTSRNAS